MNEGLNLTFVTLIFMNFSLEELRNYGGGRKLSGFWTRRRWLVSESCSPTNVNATSSFKTGGVTNHVFYNPGRVLNNMYNMLL